MKTTQAIFGSLVSLFAISGHAAVAGETDRSFFAAALSRHLKGDGIHLPAATDCANASSSFNCRVIGTATGLEVWLEPTQNGELSRVRVTFEGMQAAQMAMEVCSAAAVVWPTRKSAPKRAFQRPFDQAARVGNWTGTIAGRQAFVYVDQGIQAGRCVYGG